MHAIVAPLPDKLRAASHGRAVAGMIGMELLWGNDLVVDVPGGSLQLLPAGEGTSLAEATWPPMTAIPLAVLPSRVLGIGASCGRVMMDSGGGVLSRSDGKACGVVSADQGARVFPAVLDTGATMTFVNTPAAAVTGLVPADAKQAQEALAAMARGPLEAVAAVGVDGRASGIMPRTVAQVALCGKLASETTVHSLVFDPVPVAIGPVPALRLVLAAGDAKEPYLGPGGLIGMDVLSQRRWILCAARRRLYVAC
ncbi:unnamed protein product [Pedinophyceae sp. YPF-701]|nr:unnamed protein product [Pedinophyceae sp. YPF-701]